MNSVFPTVTCKSPFVFNFRPKSWGGGGLHSHGPVSNARAITITKSVHLFISSFFFVLRHRYLRNVSTDYNNFRKYLILKYNRK